MTLPTIKCVESHFRGEVGGVPYIIHIKRPYGLFCKVFSKFRSQQRPIFPGGYPPSIVGDESLYDRVRDGNGWFPFSLPLTNLF